LDAEIATIATARLYAAAQSSYPYLFTFHMYYYRLRV